MSKWVYLSQNSCLTTRWEDIPMRIRIQLSAATVKALHSRLQHAYRKDDVRLVRRITVLLDLLVHHVPISVVGNQIEQCCRYDHPLWRLRLAGRHGLRNRSHDESSLVFWYSLPRDVRRWMAPPVCL